MPTIWLRGKRSKVGTTTPPVHSSYSFIASLGRIALLQAKHVEQRSFITQNGTDTVKEMVLQDIKIEIHERCIRVGLLEAERVVGNGKAVQRICQHAAQDLLRFVLLRQVDINRPDGITAAAAKLHKEHLSPDELVALAPGDFTIAATRILRPQISFLLDLS